MAIMTIEEYRKKKQKQENTGNGMIPVKNSIKTVEEYARERKLNISLPENKKQSAITGISGYRTSLVTSESQGNKSSGLTGVSVNAPTSSAGITREQQARLTAEENILKKYGTYEQFRQKNAVNNKTVQPLMAPVTSSDAMEKMEQGAYEKLIQDETDRLLNAGYSAYGQYVDNIEAQAQKQAQAAQGQKLYTGEEVAIQRNTVRKLEQQYSQIMNGGSNHRVSVKDADKAKNLTAQIEEEKEKLEYMEYYSEGGAKESQKKQEWTTKQRENLEKIRDMDDVTREMLEVYLYGHTKDGEDEEQVKKTGRAGGSVESGRKKAAKKSLKEKGYSDKEIASLADTLERAENAEDAEEFRNRTEKNVNANAGVAILANAASVGANLVSGAGVVPAAEAWIKGVVTGEYTPIDTNDPLYRPGEFRDIVRQTTSQNIENSVDNKVLKKVLSMAYNAGMSTADTFTASALGGTLGGGAKAGEVLSLATMSAGAASSGTQEAFERTGNTGRALASGVTSGAIEYLTEKVSLDHLWDIIQKSGSAAGKKVIVNLLAQAGIEGSEEGASEILNRITDNCINGKDSQYNQNVQQYMEQGLDKKEATTKAEQDFWLQTLESFAVGSMAGLMGGGLGTIMSTGPSKESQAVMDAEFDSRIAEKEKNGKKLKMKEKAAIREQVESDLAKGRISIDTIEKVLGGETYEKYRAAVEQEETLAKEFDTLNKMKQGEMTGEQIDRRAELKEQLAELKKNSNKTQLKEQLSQEVEKLAVNDDFLRESYNERGRRREAYQIAENAKYSEKQREIVQKAADSGILNNTRRTHEFVDMIAKLAAEKEVSFDFTNNAKLKESGFVLEGKTVNGFVKDGTIVLNLESNQMFEKVVGHEIMYVLEGTKLDPALQQAVKEYATTKGEYDTRLQALTELYKGVENANVENELTADLVGEYLFTDEEFVKNLSVKHQNLFQKIYNEIKYMLKVATAGSKEARQLEKVKHLFEEAYRENAKTSSNDGTKYHVSSTFSEEIDKALNNQMDSSNQVKARDYTPKYLVEEGARNLPMLITQNHVRTVVYTETEAKKQGLQTGKNINYHGLGKELLINAIDNMDSPLEVYKKDDNNFIIVTELVDNDGNSIIVPVRINGKGTYNNVFIDENHITSVYGKKNLQNYLSNNSFEKVDTEKGTTLNERVQYPDISDSSKDSVPQNQQNASGNSKKSGGVTYSLSENADVTQSQQFKRWFGDWQNHPESASKVVNADGTPMVMYHGTKAENGDFTVFDYSKAVKRGGIGMKALGKGNYFTSKPLDGSERFGSRVIKAYLSIKKPFVYDASSGDAISLAEQVAQKTGADTRGLSHDALQDKMRELGYDGVIEYRRDGSLGIAVTFDSNQIKSATDNIGTFDGSNPDIRYSLSNKDDIAPIDSRYTYGKDSLSQQTAQADVTTRYQADVDKVLNMQNTKQDHLVIGYTPDVYALLGMPSLPFVIGTGHVYSAAKTEVEAKQDGNYRKGVHYHGLGANVIKNIYEALKDPVMVIASKDVNKNATPLRSTHSVVAIVDIGDSQKSLLLPVEITADRSVNGERMDVNALSSVYEKSITNLVKEAIAMENTGNVGIYYAKKEAMTLIGAGVQFPVRLQQSITSDGIVHKFSEKVNMNISDVTQSQQFKRWFGDWQNHPESASKVVNEDGTPKVVYHGTGSEFYTFDEARQGENYMQGEGGFFFTTSRQSAERYARLASKDGNNRVVEAYLSIKKPYEIQAYGDYVQAPAEKYDDHRAEYLNEAEINGCDGIIVMGEKSTLYVVFDSTQIKSATDNIGTFDGSNPDIRYSLSNKDDIAPIDSRYTYGKDITLEQDQDIAPIRKDIAGKEIAPAQKSGQESRVEQDMPPVAQSVIRENYEHSEDKKLYQYILDAIAGKLSKKSYHKLSNSISDRMANDIERIVGFSVKGYGNEISPNHIQHIEDRHGANGEADHSMQNLHDVAKMGYVINTYDRMVEGDLNYEYKNSDGSPSKTVVIQKKIDNGYYYVVEAVPDAKRKTLHVVSAYINKNDTFPEVGVSKTLNPNARNEPQSNVSSYDDRIPQSAEDVTKNIKNNDIAQKEIRPSESPKTVKELNQIKRDNYQIELERLQKEAKKAHQEFNRDIAEKQAEYDRKKDKNTKVARDLQRRIDSLKTRRDNSDADFERRMNKLQDRIAKMNTEEFKRAEQRMTVWNKYTEWARNLIGDNSKWKDKKLGISYQVNTLQRNLAYVVRDADGKPNYAKAREIYDALQGSEGHNHSEAFLNREINGINEKFQEFKINKYEDAYIQMLGEHKYNPDCTLTPEKLTKFYEKHKDKIDTAKVDQVIEEARQLYDSLFERLNSVLREQGMKEIPYREGYFPHFTEDKQGFLAKLFNWKTRNDSIPTDIAGLTENFNPDRSWQSFNKHRTGDTTDYSFKKGLDSYVRGALDWIYHIEDIQKRRAFENEIRYQYSETGVQEEIQKILNDEMLDADEVQERIDKVYDKVKNHPLNNFVTDFRNATNNLAGKKSTADRGLEYATNRKIYSTMTNLSNRVSANMVGGSISSALTNFIPITQSWGEVSPVSSLKAMRDTIKSYIRDDGMVGQSDFMTNRLNQPENLYQNGWDKANKAVGIMMDCIDGFTTQVVWRSKYIENVKSGMNQQEAIKNADYFAEGLMAGRSRGNMPTIFNSKNPVTKLFTAFQLEVANQYGYMFKDMPQNVGSRSMFQLTKGYASMFIGAYLYNALYSSLTGRDAAFDPIGIIEDLLRDLGVIGDDDDKEKDFLGAMGNLTENLLDETPFVGGLLGGGRVPISAALPYDDPVSMVKGTFSDISKGDWKGLTKEWLNPVYYLAMPMGGGQLRKTVQGLSMFRDDLPVSGSYTNSGNLRFPVKDTVANRIQAGIFGQYANENARDYFDGEHSPLNEKQIQEYKDLDIPIQDYWKYREGLKGLNKMEDKTEYIAGLDLPISKKNILINNASSRKEHIDLTGYENFKDFEEFDFSIKNPAKYEFLKDNDISYEKYSTYKSHKEAYDWAYQNQDKFEVAKAAAGGAVAYRKYAKAIDGIKADQDSSGKAVSGSRKKKVTEYINGLDLDYGQKLLLYKNVYTNDNTYNQEIVDYLNSREDISYHGMETILRELGFTVEADGTVRW